MHMPGFEKPLPRNHPEVEFSSAAASLERAAEPAMNGRFHGWAAVEK